MVPQLLHGRREIEDDAVSVVGARERARVIRRLAEFLKRQCYRQFITNVWILLRIWKLKVDLCKMQSQGSFSHRFAKTDL